MEVALIPPISQSKYYHSKYQLALAHLFDVPEYRWIFDHTANQIILDNGAAEGAQVSNDKLCDVANEIGASEIAIPDKMHNWRSTHDMATDFLDKYYDGVGKAKLGLVAQGRSFQESFNLVRSLMESEYGPYIQVIYIPRLLVNYDHYARARVATLIHKAYGDEIEIHLFGSSVAWAEEVAFCARRTPFVRSIDTSLPFVATLAGIDLTVATAQDRLYNITRPPGYFNAAFKPDDEVLLERNVQIYKEWASGKKASRR